MAEAVIVEFLIIVDFFNMNAARTIVIVLSCLCFPVVCMSGDHDAKRALIYTCRGKLPNWCQYTFWGWNRHKLTASSLGDYLKKFPLARGSKGAKHYCHGLCNFLKGDRSRLSVAIGEFTYMMEHNPSRHPMYLKSLELRGWSYYIAGSYNKALIDFNRLVRRRPKKTSIYIVLANIYMLSGMKNRAISILKDGLRENPGAMKIKMKLREIS